MNLKEISVIKGAVIFMAVLFVFYACRKESGNQQLKLAGISKEKILQWLDSQGDNSSVGDHSFIRSIQSTAQWDQATTVSVNNEKELVVVPFHSPLGNKELVLMKLPASNNIMMGYVSAIQFDGAQKNLTKAQVLANYFAERGNNFSGTLSAATVNNEFLFEYRMQNGRRLSGKSQMPVAIKKQNNGTISAINTGAPSCTDFYLVTYWSDGTTSYDYMYTSCTTIMDGCPIMQAFPSNGEIRTVLGNCNTYGGGTSGGATKDNSSSVKDIVDSLTNKCQKAVLQSLMAAGLGNAITGILKETFGVTDKLNVVFEDVPLTKDPTTPGYTNPQRKDEYLDIHIELNNTVLANSSKEYLAETMFHEIMHGYFDANNTFKGDDTTSRELAQHIEMSKSYLDKEVIALRELFPNLSLYDAQCLVIGGYGDIQKNRPNMMDAILEKYNLTGYEVQNTNNKYKNGKKGTKC